MSRLCFGSFATILKDATTESIKSVVEILANGIIEGSGDKIDENDKYKLFNSKLDKQYFKDAAGTIKIANSINQYFIDFVIPCLTVIKINELIDRLKGLISGDETITEADKSDFSLKANKEHLSEFLSTVFLFAALRPNNLKKKPFANTCYKQ